MRTPAPAPNAQPDASGGAVAACQGQPADLAAPDCLLDLYERMIGGLYLPDAFRHVAELLCETLSAERATVYVLDAEAGELHAAVMLGNVPRQIRVPLNHRSLAGHCALTKEAFVVPDAYGDLSGLSPEVRFDRAWDERNAFRTRDVMCAPCLLQGRVLGVIQVLNSRRQPFQAGDLPLLHRVARLVACALYHERLYSELAEAKQLRKQNAAFMRIMVHELKTPLAGASMLLDLLREKGLDTPRADLSRRVSDRLTQMNAMIHDVLSLAHVKSGEPFGEALVLDLVAETRTVCEHHAEQAALKGLRWDLRLPEAPVCARVARNAWRLVASNLISNAIKYTPAGGVTVAVQAAGAWAVLTVTDTGLGIPAADLPRVFEDFYRAGNVRRAHIAGTGVGLASVKELVERCRGEIELDSRENEGSRFTVRLPLAAEASVAPANAEVLPT